METNLRLLGLANRVRNVLGCSSVSLFLECADPLFRHPLLASLSKAQDHVLLSTRNEHMDALLQHERVRAVYDMAMQTRLLWCIDSLQIPLPHLSEHATFSIAVAPLERPEGIIGFFFCIADQPAAFYSNRCALLEQRLPELSYELEQILKWQYEHPRSLCAERSLQMVNNAITPTEIKLEMHEQSGFISLVSHELRVPLTAIKGYAGLLQAYSPPALAEKPSDGTSSMMTLEKQQHYLDVIMEQTCHMEVLVNDLLDLSGLQAGRLIVRCETIDIARLCQRVIQIAQRRLGTSSAIKHTLHLQCPASLPHVWADPDRVEQILTNLVDNAVKYSPDGGRIDVIVSSGEQPSFSSAPPSRFYKTADPRESCEVPMLTISVRDEGIGMSRREQAVVVQPFIRGEQAATKKIAGSGLGLYLARILVEAMHGTLSLTSQPRQGTNATFTLPLAVSQEASPAIGTLYKVMVGA